MRELFKTFNAVDKVIIAINGYEHYHGTTTGFLYKHTKFKVRYLLQLYKTTLNFLDDF